MTASVGECGACKRQDVPMREDGDLAVHDREPGVPCRNVMSLGELDRVTAQMRTRMLQATTAGEEVCSKCERPKAVARDVIRWLSGADGYAFACFDGVDYSRLMPDEEAVPGAEILKERLVEARRAKEQFVCAALEQEILGRRRRRA